MAAQEHVTLARSLFELFNHRQSDPAWLEKSMAALAADAEVIDVPSGATLHGPEGHKRLLLFLVESFPIGRAVWRTKPFPSSTYPAGRPLLALRREGLEK